jgi:hypothetical protein
MHRVCFRLFLAAIVASLIGCASYIAPGAKADLQAFAPASIQEGFAAKATAPFPASIAVVRVQAPAYTNYRLQQTGGAYGSGRYSVITTREVEEESHVERIARLPQVVGVTSCTGGSALRLHLRYHVLRQRPGQTTHRHHPWSVSHAEGLCHHHSVRFAHRHSHWLRVFDVRDNQEGRHSLHLLG